MIEIKTGQELEVNKVLSFRGKIQQNEVEKIGMHMEAKLREVGSKRIGNPITAIYGVDGMTMDVEILLPIDKNTGTIGDYQFKEKIKLVNAVVASYKGNPTGLQDACNELNKYIMENKLQPITVGYDVPKKVDSLNIDDSEIDVYVGINPNVL